VKQPPMNRKWHDETRFEHDNRPQTLRNMPRMWNRNTNLPKRLLSPMPTTDTPPSNRKPAHRNRTTRMARPPTRTTQPTPRENRTMNKDNPELSLPTQPPQRPLCDLCHKHPADITIQTVNLCAKCANNHHAEEAV
jgi:hypothetical protein